MHVRQLRLKGFRSFGPRPTTIELTSLTFVLGPNGAGKTAALVALARLFSPVPALRRVQSEDFHVPIGDAPEPATELWLEVDVEFEEAADESGQHPSIPPFFSQMALHTADGVPQVRIRLTAIRDSLGYIDEKIEFITQVDDDGEPIKRSDMSRHDRAAIEVHYLPARRDPADHIAYTTASLLGRMLRCADWAAERAKLAGLAEDISASMAQNDAVAEIGTELQNAWDGLHKGSFFASPAIAFGRGDLEGILRQLTVDFAPSPVGGSTSFERLSDGQKSLLYVSLVLAWRGVARRVLSQESTAFKAEDLRPPVHVILALEEPENSLAPHYLGRIVRQLREACGNNDAQGLVATHAPALLHRVEPEDIRFLRLSADRTTTVRTITMPSSAGDAAKYVREAVLAHPEVYFARLVVLGEGDSEQIVLPRILAAADIAADDVSVCVAPLGGRHVNHFWRLLESLDIPYVTLLDLDCARFGGGWGRVRYAANQLNRIRPHTFKQEAVDRIAKWDADKDFPEYDPERGGLQRLERHGVFYSYPLDLDLMLLDAYPDAYGVNREAPEEATVRAVLGRGHKNVDRLDDAWLELFNDYEEQFKRGSKPASHLAAMSMLTDERLLETLPEPLMRMVDVIRQKLKAIPE